MIDQSQFSITKFFKCLQWYCIVNVGGKSPNVRCQDRLAGAQSAWERKEPCQQTSCGHISENNPSSAWHEHCHLVISIIDGGDTFELHPVAATEVVPEFFGQISFIIESRSVSVMTIKRRITSFGWKAKFAEAQLRTCLVSLWWRPRVTVWRRPSRAWVQFTTGWRSNSFGCTWNFLN